VDEPARGLPLLVDLPASGSSSSGAGPVATAKVRSLGPAGAEILVIAPDAVAAIADAAAAGTLRWERRRYDEGDLAGAALVVAATADRDGQRRGGRRGRPPLAAVRPRRWRRLRGVHGGDPAGAGSRSPSPPGCPGPLPPPAR
jgi:hypothetical protein